MSRFFSCANVEAAARAAIATHPKKLDFIGQEYA
jgi:hypothetical protein